MRYEQRLEDDSASSSITEERRANHFIAILNLKHTDMQLDVMKRRLSALSIKEEKNNRKSQVALKKVKYHQMVQEMEQKQREKLLHFRAEQDQRIYRQRFLNSAERTSNQSKRKEAKQMFVSVKRDSYAAEKQASRQLAEKLKQMEQSKLEERYLLKSRVRQYQKRSRQAYRLYNLQRQREAQSLRQNESSRIVELQQKKELEMRQLARLELQMVERHSRSRESANNSTEALSKVLNSHSAGKSNTGDIKKVKNPEYLKIL